MIKESKCTFKEREGCKYIKIDEHEEYRKRSQKTLKCIDLVIVDENVYFVEIKCYEFFGKELDTKVIEILQKLKDTLFFLFFYEIKDKDIETVRRKLLEKTPYLVVVICPPCNLQSENISPDQMMILRDILLNKFKDYLDYIAIDTNRNLLNLFSSIERE